MIAKEMDYQWHYDEFLRRRESNPSLRMARYCEEAGVRRQRMYEWMTRRGLSLKKIYAEASKRQQPSGSSSSVPSTATSFSPLRILPTSMPAQEGPGLDRVRITMPNGVAIELERCSAEELMVLTGGPLYGNDV